MEAFSVKSGIREWHLFSALLVKIVQAVLAQLDKRKNLRMVKEKPIYEWMAGKFQETVLKKNYIQSSVTGY